MKHFLKIGQVDPTPLLHQVTVNPELWNGNTIRTRHPGSAHEEADDIILRFNDVSEFERTGDFRSITDDRTCHEWAAWNVLTEARPIIFPMMARVQGVQLGRVMVTRLRPGKRIKPHVDGGSPAEFYERYQIALQSMPGCTFRIGDENVQFASGDVWWIDNRTEHEVINNSADDRIVMIVDIRVPK